MNRSGGRILHVMVNFFHRLKSEKLLAGSFVLVIASFLAALGNYFLQFIVGRKLGPDLYGSFASLTSLFLILSVFSGTLQLMVVRIVSAYKASQQESRVLPLRAWLTKTFGLIGVVGSVLFLLLAKPISEWLNVTDINATRILAIVLLFYFILSANRGIIHGLQQFGHLSANIVVEVLVKVGVTIAAITYGYALSGAVSGIVGGILVAYVLSFISTRNIENKEKKPIRLRKDHLRFGVRMLLTSLSLTLLLSMDILFVNHYLRGEPAGWYSAVANLGRIIVFGTAAIAQVLLPLAAERFDRNENHWLIMRKALFFTGGAGIAAILLYLAVPNFLIRLFYGEAYVASAGLLGYMAIAMTFYALVNLFVTYFISIKEWSFLGILMLGMLVQILGIVYYHQSLMQIIAVLSLTQATLSFLFFMIAFKRYRHPSPL